MTNRGRSSPIDLPTAPLSDGLVNVRIRRDSDVPIIVAARSDPDSRRWLDDAPDDAPPRSAAEIAETWRRGEAAPMVIADADSDEPVGLINVQFRSDDEAAVAYQVFGSRRGQGIAGRALELVAGWSFRDLGVRRLLLEIDPANTASLRVAAKCGFVETDSEAAGKITFVRGPRVSAPITRPGVA